METPEKKTNSWYQVLVNGHDSQQFWDELAIDADKVDAHDSYTEKCESWHEVVLFCDRIEQAVFCLTPKADPNDVEVVFFDEAGFAHSVFSGHPGDIQVEEPVLS